LPEAAQVVVGVHEGGITAHTPLLQVYPDEQLPQFRVSPQLSDQEPQFFPRAPQVVGVHDGSEDSTSNCPTHHSSFQFRLLQDELLELYAVQSTPQVPSVLTTALG
jgi:hypothetical protein